MVQSVAQQNTANDTKCYSIDKKKLQSVSPVKEYKVLLYKKKTAKCCISSVKVSVADFCKKHCNTKWYKVLLSKILQSVSPENDTNGYFIKTAKCCISSVKVSVADPIPHIITPPPAHPSPLLSGPSS